jgi:hypothetical protein
MEQTHLSAVGLSRSDEAISEPTFSTEAVSPDRSLRRTPALALACLIGMLLGGGGLYLSQGRGEPDADPTSTASSAVPDSLVQRDQYAAALQVSTLLAEGQPLRAYQTLNRLATDSARTEVLDSLRTAGHEALYRAGRRAWEKEKYERVVQVLTPIRNATVGRAQDRLYWLGVAAAKTGRDSLAVATLRDLMPKIDAQHPHYEAQAAYLLAERGPPEVAHRYAQLISREYGDTLYNNSVVRARLGKE